VHSEALKVQFYTAKKKALPNLKNWRGAQILGNDSYFAYIEAAEDAAQQRIWAFYEAVETRR